MLGTALASQYAGWWNSGGPLIININAPGAVSQSIYQNPAFSFQYGNVGNTNPSSGLNSSGNINLTGYSSLPTANNNRFYSCRHKTGILFVLVASQEAEVATRDSAEGNREACATATATTT